jgi:CHAT domain-containing protein
MLELHRPRLEGKVSQAEAMRQAALKLKRTKAFAHPSYWAGFVVLGDAN